MRPNCKYLSTVSLWCICVCSRFSFCHTTNLYLYHTFLRLHKYGNDMCDDCCCCYRCCVLLLSTLRSDCCQQCAHVNVFAYFSHCIQNLTHADCIKCKYFRKQVFVSRYNTDDISQWNVFVQCVGVWLSNAAIQAISSLTSKQLYALQLLKAWSFQAKPIILNIWFQLNYLEKGKYGEKKSLKRLIFVQFIIWK